MYALNASTLKKQPHQKRGPDVAFEAIKTTLSPGLGYRNCETQRLSVRT